MAVTDLITAERYNALQRRIAAVLGISDTGYGMAVTSSTVIAKTTMQGLDMQKLRNDMILSRQHQTGTPVSANDLPIIVKDSVVSDSTYSLYYEPFMTQIETYKLDMANNQSTTADPVTSLRAVPWNTGVNHVIRFKFLNALDAKHFFNAGGELLISASLENPVGVKSNSWNAFLAKLGTIKITKNATTSGWTSTGTALGYSSLTDAGESGDYRVFFTGNDTGSYALNSYVVAVKKWTAVDQTHNIDVKVMFIDTVAETPSDLLVSGTLTSRVTYRIASGDNVSLIDKKPTVSTITPLTDSSSYQASLSTSTPGSSTALEGLTVTATVSNYGSSNAIVWYLIGGDVSSSDLATGTVMKAPITFDGNGQFTLPIVTAVDGILDRNTMQFFVYDRDPNLTGATQLAGSNIITITDDVSIALSSSVSEINETTSKLATISIATTGISNGKYLQWEVTGVDGKDVSSRLDIVPPNTSSNSGTSTQITNQLASFKISAKNNSTADGDIQLKIIAKLITDGDILAVSEPLLMWLRDTSSPTLSIRTYAYWLTPGVNEGTGISVDINTVNIPNDARIDWKITNKTGKITAADFDPPVLTDYTNTTVASGSVNGTATVPLKIYADSTFNEGDETFTFTATYTAPNAVVYTATTDINIKDTSTFPASFVKSPNYTSPTTLITYTKLTLSMLQWPIGSLVGDIFNYTIKAYATTDVTFTTPLITFNPGSFVNNTNSLADVLIQHPHQAYKVKATITNSKYDNFSSVLDIPSSTAPTATVAYSPDTTTVNVDSAVTYTISNGIPYGYYHFEVKNGSTYTRPTAMKQLDSNGSDTGEFTSNIAGDVITRINFINGTPSTDKTITFKFGIEEVKLVQTGPYTSGVKYTAKITNALVNDTYTISNYPKASIPVTSGTISVNANANTFEITPTAGGTVSADIAFTRSGHTAYLNFTVGATVGLTLTQNPLWTTTGVNEGTSLSVSVSTVNIPNGATINWAITNKTGTGITANDFSPATLSGFVKPTVPSGSINGTCTIPLTIVNDSSFNEGVESFILTASYTDGTQSYTGTCEVKINDTSSFPAAFTRLSNYKDPATQVMYSVLSLVMTSWPVGSVVGDKFGYDIKVYSDAGLQTPVKSLASDYFVNNYSSSISVSIPQPHPVYYVTATIKNSKYDTYTSTLQVSAAAATPLTVSYSPTTNATVDSNVIYNVAGPANAYYFFEVKNGTTYTQSDKRQLSDTGAGSGTFTSNVAGDVITRVNVISSNQQSDDHTTKFTYSTESVSLVQTAPYYTGIPYTVKIGDAKLGDTYMITELSKCKTNKENGTITKNSADNVFTVTPIGTDESYNLNLTVGFAQSGHKFPLSIAALTKGLTYSASTLYGDITGKITTDITITLSNATFVVDLASTSTYVTFPNAPTWLSPVITRLSDTQVRLTITTRSPTADNLATGFSNLNITFLDAAFTDGGAATLLNYKYNVNIKFPTITKFTTDDVFVVPAGVSQIQFTAVGGMGGGGGKDTNWGYCGFSGTVVSGKFSVTPSNTIDIKVGKSGGSNLSAGNNTPGGLGGVGYSNGGGGGSSGGTGISGSGGGGGGSSALSLNGTVIVIAGGGGGGGGGGQFGKGQSNTNVIVNSGSTGGHGANRGSSDGAGGGGGGGGYVGGGGGNLVSGDKGGYSGESGTSYTNQLVTSVTIVPGVSSGAVDPKTVTQYFPGYVVISYQLP
jgi:hypothetical protein